MDAADCVRNYKSLANVERAFRSLKTIDLKVREFSPAVQVVARLEVSGPGRFLPPKRGGVDVHGDGTVSAYVGGVRRRTVEAKGNKTPYDALRKALTG